MQDDVSNLVDLGVPCKLIYARTRGGRISDPVLHRHPESTGRRNDIEPPAEMPDLSPADLRPMDGRWICGFQAWGSVSPYCIFRGWTDEAHALFPRYPEGLAVACDDFKPHKPIWLPKRLKKGGLDGRSAIAIVNANEFWGTSVVLRRRIDRSDAVWTLEACFEDVELFRSRRSIVPSTIPDLAAAAALILAVDAGRMLRRSMETLPSPAVQIRIGDEASDRSMQISDAVVELLGRRAVRIEPLHWKALPINICSGVSC